MATRPIVPRANGEGSLGVNTAGAPKYWGNVFTNKINDIPVENLGSVPLGFTTPLLQSTAPDGWLACQGAEVSRATYPDLWNLVSSTNQFITEQEWQNKNTAGGINIGWFSSGDGTTTFRLPRIVGSGELTEVKRFTTAGSGSFTAPVTGIYRITLQGAGGGGAGGQTALYGNRGGGGGGQGGYNEFYEPLTAGVTYSFTIGAGGTGGSADDVGSNGTASSITINSNVYISEGGQRGGDYGSASNGGLGGLATINGVSVGRSTCGGAGGTTSNSGTATAIGGFGGGGIFGTANNGESGSNGGGGSGGGNNNGTAKSGGNGGDGYIEFAYNPVPQYWYVRAFGSATNQGTIDITALANLVNTKADDDDVLHLVGGGALTGNNLKWNGADLGGASIVAQSIGSNGYVKYSNGLIMQWGRATTIPANGTANVQFPISFTNTPAVFATSYHEGENSTVKDVQAGANSFNIWINGGVGTEAAYWFAIGY